MAQVACHCVPVELNRGIVALDGSRSAIQPEDRLEVVHFVGGGNRGFQLTPCIRGEMSQLGHQG